jgi:beta-lactamase superfamily II metal-dependent hydrolase
MAKQVELYQLTPDKNVLMNCYVIKTKTGKLIVVDGGGKPIREKTGSYLYSELQKISGKEIPEIEAWFLSHMHDDHVTEFYKIVEDEQNPIKIKNVYFNFPPYEYFERAEGGGFAYLYKKIEKAYDKLFGDGSFSSCEGKTAYAGDVFEIDGVKIEILLTYFEDKLIEIINDTSIVFRAEVEGQRILFLGDTYFDQGDRLLEKYGSDLESHIVQMSHHGQNGVNESVYNAIKPKLCLWPSPDWVFDNWNGNLNTFETRKWIIKMGVKYHFITGRYKTQQVTLPVDFDASTPEDISVPQK